ncbi:MAG: D-alanyl-D-alanine carboxypeptidase [Candidatus Omnitrophica bacterium]|nr:D-alanyl-D-alanine carboxypeptidase [Candidatus Omnitrophota bacterium]
MHKIHRFSVVMVLAVFVCQALMPSMAEARRKARAHTAVPAKPTGPFKVTAKAALFVDDRMRVLYDKDASRRVFPASTTKIMTALIVLERLPLDQLVTISPKAASILPSKIDAKAGERYTVRDLLYCALLNSANDAAIALAEAAAGSEKQFVTLMNDRARWIGAKHTLFANAHGLPSDDPQFTTAYDMALIFREAMKKPFFREAIQFRYRTVFSEAGRKIVLKSHNKSLFQGWKQDVYGKTGYTREAQACFVGYAEKDSHQYIIAVFGCPHRWEDVKYIIEHYGGINL